MSRWLSSQLRCKTFSISVFFCNSSIFIDYNFSYNFNTHYLLIFHKIHLYKYLCLWISTFIFIRCIFIQIFVFLFMYLLLTFSVFFVSVFNNSYLFFMIFYVSKYWVFYLNIFHALFHLIFKFWHTSITM